MDDGAVSQRNFLKRRLEKAKQEFESKGQSTGKALKRSHTVMVNNTTEYHCVEEKSFTNLENSSGSFPKFAGKYIGDLLSLEIFAGTARLSKIARDTGFQTLPIDKTAARASQIFIAQYDLTEPEALKAVLDILHTEKDRILAVHLAPACGTAPRAREKKLTAFAKRALFDQPGSQWGSMDSQAWTRYAQKQQILSLQPQPK